MSAPFLLSYVAPFSVLVGACLGGWGYYLTWLIAFALHPVLDTILGQDPKAGVSTPSTGFGEAILLAYPPIQLALLAWSLHHFATANLAPFEAFGLVVSIGLSTGAIGITAAHELVHRRKRWERGLGVMLLAMVSYSHFRIEHVHGHHRHIATPKDPASSRLGETVYRFWGRSLLGGWLSAWRIEKERLASKGRGVLNPRNRMLHYLVIEILACTAIGATWGASALGFFFIQSAIAILLLETINYIEHYGLERKLRDNGQYEPVSVRHSWDSGHRVSNWFLFNLARHADHHAHPLRKYESLRVFPEAPRLPMGYSTSILVALLPPLWRRIMDPRAREARTLAS